MIAEAITEQRRLFRETFGREPEPADPRFLNPESRISRGTEVLEETWRTLVQAAEGVWAGFWS